MTDRSVRKRPMKRTKRNLAVRRPRAGRTAPALRRTGSTGTAPAGKRELILGAALQEFSARGFAAARLDDVARRAGVAKGTIYLYFRDKETLFQELVRAELSPIVAGLETAAVGDLPLRIVSERLVTI